MYSSVFLDYLKIPSKAICVLAPGKPLVPEELIHFVAFNITRYKKPKYLIFVDTLPKTEGDEIDRDQIKREHGVKY
jgi:acyl-coenzyme A synthetase/AMP-(fatty) acid ligase